MPAGLQQQLEVVVESKQPDHRSSDDVMDSKQMLDFYSNRASILFARKLYLQPDCPTTLALVTAPNSFQITYDMHIETYKQLSETLRYSRQTFAELRLVSET